MPDAHATRNSRSWIGAAFGVLLLAVVVTVFGVKPDRPAAAQENIEERLAAAELHVVGGAIQVGPDLIKIKNIDVGEPPPLARCRRESETAMAAEARIASLLSTPGAEILLRRDLDAGKDDHGRASGSLEVNGADIGTTLIRAGLAVPKAEGASAWCGA